MNQYKVVPVSFQDHNAAQRSVTSLNQHSGNGWALCYFYGDYALMKKDTEDGKMTQWEYNAVLVTANIMDHLAEAGRNGWELVGFDDGRAYFKRPVDEQVPCDDPICCDGDCLCQT